MFWCVFLSVNEFDQGLSKAKLLTNSPKALIFYKLFSSILMIPIMVPDCFQVFGMLH